MILFCVRVCRGNNVLFQPKWVAIENQWTFVDLLRYTTGDQFIKSKIIVVVSGEISRDSMVQVSIKDSVTVLEDKDKKMVSYLLEPENKLSLVLVSYKEHLHYLNTQTLIILV